MKYASSKTRNRLAVHLEPLESRQLLTTVYVDDTWTLDIANSFNGDGSLTIGDPVISAGNTFAPNGTTASYGVTGFGHVTNTTTPGGSLPGAALINDAITNASANDTVTIYDGTYTESDVVVNKPLILSGTRDATSNTFASKLIPETTSSHSDQTNFGVGTHSGVIIYAATVTVQNLWLDGNGNGSLGGSQNYHQGITTLYDTQNGGAYSSLHSGNISPQEFGTIDGGRPNRSIGHMLIQNDKVENVFYHGITLSANAGQQYGMSGSQAMNQITQCTVNNVGAPGTQGYDQVGILAQNLDNYPNSSPSLGPVPAGTIFQSSVSNAGVGAALRVFGTLDTNNGARIKAGMSQVTVTNAVTIGIEANSIDSANNIKLNTINFAPGNSAIGLSINNSSTTRYSSDNINNAHIGIKVTNSSFGYPGVFGAPLLGGFTNINGPGTGEAGSIGILLTNSAGGPIVDTALSLNLNVNSYETGVKAEQPFAQPTQSGTITGAAGNVTALSGTISSVTGGNGADYTITTSAAHGLSIGDRVTLTNIGGVPGANGTWTIGGSNLTANTFSLDGSNDVNRGVSTGYVAATGNWVRNPAIRITSTAHGLATGQTISITGVNGTVEANGVWTVTVIDANTFDLNGSVFTDTYSSGGTWRNPPQAHLVLDRPTIAGNKVGFNISGSYLVEGNLSTPDPVIDPGATFEAGYSSFFYAFYNSITNQQQPATSPTTPPGTTIRLQDAKPTGITPMPATTDVIKTGNFSLDSTSTLKAYINQQTVPTAVTVNNFNGGALFYTLTTEVNPFHKGFQSPGAVGTWLGNSSQSGGSITITPAATELGAVFDLGNVTSPIDARGMTKLQVVAKSVVGNQANEFFIVFGDKDGTSYAYNFPFAALNTVSYTTLSLNIVAVGANVQSCQTGLNMSAISSWALAGNLGDDTMDASLAFGINVDDISLIAPDTNSKIQVTGTVSLNGATLGAALGGNFVPSLGSTYTLIDNDGSDPVSGTFAGQPEGSTVSIGATKFTISYVGNGPSGNNNDVVLTRIPGEDHLTPRLFYRGSIRFDVTNNNLPGFSDDNAIAPDKTAYLPGGGPATFSAVSSYSRGINGIMVDMGSTHGTLSANDFIFKVGNNNSPSTWATVASAVTVTTRSGAGVGGSDRVELMWANNAIQKQWLEVVVKGNDTLGGSNTNTGLSSSYVFYFGNALGDSGSGDTTTFLVNSTDEISARNDPHNVVTNPATITNVNDYNRDGSVNSTDQVTSRNNTTNAVTTALKFLTVSAGGPFAPVSDGGDATAAPLASSSTSSGSGDSGISSGLASTASPASSPAPSLPGWVSLRLDSLADSQLSTNSSTAVAQAVLEGLAGADDDDNSSLGDLLAGL